MSRAEVVFMGLIIGALITPEACIAKGEGGQHCAPSSCGNIGNISFPFRLKADPPECGDHAFELACDDNNRTTLNSTCFGKLYVQEINYDNQTVRVVDATTPPHKADTCSLPRYSFTTQNYNYDCFGPAYSWRYHAIGLMNCTKAVNSSLYVDATPCINTSFSSPSPSPSPNNSHFYFLVNFNNSYYFAYYEGPSISDILELCSLQFVVPTLFFNNTSISSPSVFDIYNHILKGFDLQYSFDDYKYKWTFKDSLHAFLNGLREVLADLRYSLFSVSGYHTMFRYPRSQGQNSTVQSLPPYEIKADWYGSNIIKGYFPARISLGMLCFIAFLIYKFKRRHLSIDDTIEEFLQSHNNLMPIRYSYSELKKMTKGFNQKLGQGGYGSVYKGKLRSGHLVAVKVLGKSKANGQDFISEVATIGRIYHVNVVRLIGFCVEGSKRALVFDFMFNGSLDKFIFHEGEQSNPLNWERTFKIGLGIAKGIEYLHRGCDMQILHFDIKPHNILLDENFIPKVSDFGLAKLYPIDDSIVSLTVARGTIGYIAPELIYKNIGGISYKADVYSFGTVLMEMVGKKKNINPHAEHSSQIYFPSWIYDRINQGEDIELGDANEDDKKIARKMIIVALWCIQLNPVDRPSMSKVLEMLESKVELLQMPPKPFLYPQEMSKQEPVSSYNDIGTITLDVR